MLFFGAYIGILPAQSRALWWLAPGLALIGRRFISGLILHFISGAHGRWGLALRLRAGYRSSELRRCYHVTDVVSIFFLLTDGVWAETIANVPSPWPD